MKNFFLSLLTILIFNFGANAQTFEWANLRGSLGTDYVYGISSDNQGNIYNVGTYTNPTNDFDPGSGTLTLPHAGNECGFIQKLDASGNLVWAKSLYTAPNDKQVIIDIQVASNGDLYITGTFRGTVDFDMGAGTASLTSQNSGATSSGFILKLDAAGNYIWAKQFLSMDCTVQRVAIESGGNIIVTGWFAGFIDLDPSSTAASNRTAQYDKEAFVVKLDASGTYIWGEVVGGPVGSAAGVSVIGRDVKVDSNGDIFVLVSHNATAGLEYTNDTANTDFSTSTTVHKGNVLLKVSSTDGSLSNSRVFYGSTTIALEMAIDTNDNIYVTGFYRHDIFSNDNSGTQIFLMSAPGSINGDRYFVISFANDLTYRWGHGALNTNSMFSRGYSISINSQNQIAIGGFASAQFPDVDPNVSSTVALSSPTGAGNRMAQTIIYDSQGNYVSSFAVGGNSQFNQIQKIYYDNNDNLYLGGYIESNTNYLNPFGAPTNIPLIGGRDAFLVKIGMPCVVNIPDANFKTYLVGNTAINTNGDTEIQCSEASAFTGLIDCGNLSISDLTGIEAFTSLTNLYCHTNSLNSLDVTQNTALTYLDCNNNSISSLDVTQNTALTRLYCYTNSINSLDVTQNTVLERLSCNNNSISNLDVTQNTALTQLWCHTNSINSLDVTQNTVLTYLKCNDNSLSSLDVIQNTALTRLDCNNNSISSLDVTQNTALNILFCHANSLISLNVANGNNSNFIAFNATSNLNLTCIEVDNVAYSTTNWTNIDATTSFGLNCGAVGITEPIAPNNLSIYPNPTTSHITINNEELNIENILIMDVTGKVITSSITTSTTIYVNNLIKGIYFLQVQTDKGLFTNKFIKE